RSTDTSGSVLARALLMACPARFVWFPCGRRVVGWAIPNGSCSRDEAGTWESERRARQRLPTPPHPHQEGREANHARHGRRDRGCAVVAHPARGTDGPTHMSEARLILTCGLTGAGKTTLARQLAADRSALRLTQDEWLTALGSSPWDEQTREKVDHQLWILAQEVL